MGTRTYAALQSIDWTPLFMSFDGASGSSSFR
jgi:hypothetical protein